MMPNLTKLPIPSPMRRAGSGFRSPIGRKEPYQQITQSQRIKNNFDGFDSIVDDCQFFHIMEL